MPMRKKTREACSVNREGIIDPSSLVARSSIAGYMLRHLAHLADSNHNSESAANSKRFSFLLSVDQKMQRRGEEGGGESYTVLT